MHNSTVVENSPETSTDAQIHQTYWSRRWEAGKPLTRGWLHLLAAPLALANAIVLIVFANTAPQVLAAVIFLVASLALFGFSAAYHLVNWSPRMYQIMRSIDHSNIFVLIAGTYTPITISILEGSSLIICLAVVWTGGVIGSVMNITWSSAPRWLYVGLYIAVGWVAIWYLPEIWRASSPAVVWLIIAGGICYTIGAVFYATKWPNPWPRHFGFHEFFHLSTVLAYACHAVAIWLAYAQTW